MTIFGWTLPQWSEAAGWYERAHGLLTIPDVSGAVDLQMKWKSLRGDDPGQRLIITDIERPVNQSWAIIMAKKVLNA